MQNNLYRIHMPRKIQGIIVPITNSTVKTKGCYFVLPDGEQFFIEPSLEGRRLMGHAWLEAEVQGRGYMNSMNQKILKVDKFKILDTQEDGIADVAVSARPKNFNNNPLDELSATSA